MWKSIIFPYNVTRSQLNLTFICSTQNQLDPCIGPSLVPYFRRILPALNLFHGRNVNLKHRIDFDRVGRLGDQIEQTLMILERCGGEHALLNIKHVIPTYESYVNNWKSLAMKCIKENWKENSIVFLVFFCLFCNVSILQAAANKLKSIFIAVCAI